VPATPGLESISHGRPTTDMRKSRVISALVGVALLAFLITYGGRIGLFLFTRWAVRDTPQVWLVPTPLAVVPTNRLTGKKFSYFGYDFETPWTELTSERRLDANDNSNSAVNLTFSTGNVVVIFDPAKQDPLQVLKQEAAKRGEQLGKYFDGQSLQTNYSWRAKELYLTPHDINVFSPRQEVAGNYALIIMKSAELRRIKGGLYSFQTERFRGFQEGNPVQDEVVIVEAFDSQDRLIKLFIASDHAGQHNVSQADINQIVGSLRPTIDASTSASKSSESYLRQNGRTR
jgi:hypothetical protein